MRQKGKKWSTIVLAVLALVLVVNFGVSESMAYFTTYATAKGGYWITLGSSSEIREKMVEWDKYIQVENVGETPCFVRVKAFAGASYELKYTDKTDGKWSLGEDGYWYYSDPVEPGTMTGELVISIKVPEDLASSFDVTVIQESTAVLYDDQGAPYADWDMEIEESETQEFHIDEGGLGDE